MRGTFVRRGTVVAVVGLAAAGCASYPTTPRLTTYDVTKGYRFEQLPKSPATEVPANSDELFVVLAFSGGGTRAAALSYGVLAQLANVRFHWNADTGQPEVCESPASPRCHAMARSLLDDVDVISSVSGGSFTSAYYALRGREIFDTTGPFHRNFLYYPVQRDLLSHAVYYPQNWWRLRSRVEIAANDYARTIFGNATFAALARSRPYLILNAADASTGARFEFTQEQFDLVCADMDQFPIARGVAASSAFPGLLNAMTIDSYNDVPRAGDGTKGCAFKGPGSRDDDWVADAVEGRFIDYRRFNAARETLAYRDPARRHLHLLDGGLADNIGLRSVLQSLVSSDRPTVLRDAGDPLLGGWSLLTMINQKKVKTIVIITVNARTQREKDWDVKRAGPGTFSVIGASSGIPMGNYSTETIELLREYANEAQLNKPGRPRFFGVEVAFENEPDNNERAFLAGMGTNFDLAPFEVDCLIDRGGRLLRQSTSVTDFVTPTSPPQSFIDFVERFLRGRIDIPDVPHPDACTAEAGKREIGTRPHYIDIGAEFGVTRRDSADVENDRGVGLAVRVTRPDGFGATVGFGSKSFGVSGDVLGQHRKLGDLRLRTLSAGLLYTTRAGAIEASAELSAGYGFGGFTIEGDVREAYGQGGVFAIKPDASNALVLAPGVSLWYSLNSKWAATVSGSYTWARPTIRFGGDPSLPERPVTAAAFRLAAGLGYRVF